MEKIANSCDITEQETSDKTSSNVPHFYPPLYIQRYSFVCKTLTDHKVESVVDFGCSECKILTLLKTVESLKTIMLVDIDDRLLTTYQDRIRPTLDNFLHRRSNPLYIQLLAGSAAILDDRIRNVEAVTLIEVIEHLTEDVLDAVIENIFQNIQPNVVIVTTPNSDFNILFPDLVGFRHWDHKFEWTRKEFQNWCEQICAKYGYQVEIAGIGDPPEEFHSVGFCSQAAIFNRKNTSRGKFPSKSSQLPYKMIAECHYPFKDTVLTLDEKLDIEVNYYIRPICLQAINDQLTEVITFPIDEIHNVRPVQRLCNLDELRLFLKKKFILTADGLSVLIPLHQFAESSDEDEETYWNEDGINCINQTEDTNSTFRPEESWD